MKRVSFVVIVKRWRSEVGVGAEAKRRSAASSKVVKCLLFRLKECNDRRRQLNVMTPATDVGEPFKSVVGSELIA